MRLVLSWLRDFVDVTAPAEEIADKLGLRGFEVAGLEPLGGSDAVIDLEVTANRPDCLSVIGLAREVATIYDLPLALPSSSGGAKIRLRPLAIGASDRLRVTVEDDDLCPRYAAAVAEVSVGTSPSWMRARLEAAGMRPISSIVDLTNYVLIELGQPMHAFDLTKLAGAEIRVRGAKAGETLTTLDGVERTLHPDMLVIADRNRAQAVAGVMGSAFSEVSSATRTVAFESAYFKPASVRRTSKRLGLKTEASARFERGADISAPVVALERIAALMEQIGADGPAGPVVDIYARRREPARLDLRRRRLAALLGIAVPDSDVERILRGLGLTVTADNDGWSVIAPTLRVDLVREVDLIEEVGRHYGFDKLDSTFPPMTVPAPPPDPRVPRDQLVRRVLTGAGLSEAVTFGFIEAKAAELFAAGPATGLISIANPLTASFDTLRASLLPGLVDAVARNRRYGRRDVGLFEIGGRFSSAIGETRGLAVAWTGAATPLHWSASARPVDFFDVKGLIEGLCRVLGVTPRFERAAAPFLAPGQAAAVMTDGTPLGVVGLLDPGIAEQRDAPRHDNIFVAELNLDRLSRAGTGKSDATRPLPRHPFVIRDLSIVVAEALPAEIIRGTILASGGTLAAPLVGIDFFDRYQGKGVPGQHVSISVRLTFQAADRTLTDADVQQSIETILGALVREHGAVQR